MADPGSCPIDSAPGASAVAGRARAALRAAMIFFCSVAAATAEQPFDAMFAQREIFLEAIAREQATVPPDLRVTGISVPHHLLAADLMARGFWAAAGGRYDRVILLSPDHFNRSGRPLATTRRDFDTVFGLVENDRPVSAALLEASDLFEDSALFEKEHGIAALLPFIKHFFGGAKVVPIAISGRSTRADWDRAVAMLRNLIGPRDLVIQSTDYSHYLPLSAAVQRDQETLNIIAASDPAAVERLVQVIHMDSKAAQYIQMRLQAEALNSHGVVVANRNSEAYGGSASRTTSYVVTVYTQTPAAGSLLRFGDQRVLYLAGDTFFGRWLAAPLSRPEVVQAVVAEVNKLTGGAPLVVNLETVLLEEPPERLPDRILVSHAGLAIPILKALNVRAASLANNHSFDVGPPGYRETRTLLERAGIRPLVHNEIADLGAVRVVALNFVELDNHPEHPRADATDLATLCQKPARPPLIAFVHWGREFTTTAGPAEHAAAAAMHACGVSAIIGAHSHLASRGIEAPQGGAYQLTFSLGNFLFDQRGARSSCALIELRVFENGTYATRLIPAPNLYELAATAMHRLTDAPVSADAPDGAPGPSD